MFEAIQKAVFASIGIGYMAKEKVEEAGKKLIAEAKLSEVEGKKFVNELLKKSENARLALEKTVNDAVTKALDKADVARRTAVETLEKRVKKLEEKIGG